MQVPHQHAQHEQHQDTREWMAFHGRNIIFSVVSRVESPINTLFWDLRLEFLTRWWLECTGWGPGVVGSQHITPCIGIKTAYFCVQRVIHCLSSALRADGFFVGPALTRQEKHPTIPMTCSLVYGYESVGPRAFRCQSPFGSSDLAVVFSSLNSHEHPLFTTGNHLFHIKRHTANVPRATKQLLRGVAHL